MMVDSEDIYHAVLGAIADHAKARDDSSPRHGNMIPIAPFDAVNFDDNPCLAVGVVHDPGNDTLSFVVLKTVEDGEIIPTTEGSLWRVGKNSTA